MKRNFVSRVMCTQMDPDSGSDTYMIKGTSLLGMIIGVVPATIPLMPKSE